MNVVDTSGWIEFLFEGKNANVFAPLVEDVDNLLVPVICLYEVFKKVNAVADEPKALQAIGQMKQGRVIEVTEAIALRAALISLKHRLPMADSLILSTAWSELATLWTHENVGSALRIKINDLSATQQRLLDFSSHLAAFRSLPYAHQQICPITISLE